MFLLHVLSAQQESDSSHETEVLVFDAQEEVFGATFVFLPQVPDEQQSDSAFFASAVHIPLEQQDGFSFTSVSFALKFPCEQHGGFAFVALFRFGIPCRNVDTRDDSGSNKCRKSKCRWDASKK